MINTGKIQHIENEEWTVKWLKKIITVEPLIACYQMGLFISKPALDNLEFEKTCRVNLRYNKTICNAILSGNHSQYNHENEEIQKIISTMHSWQQPIQSITPLILVLFLGSFSDRYKWRKPLFLIPIIGEIFGVIGTNKIKLCRIIPILKNLGCLFCVFLMDKLPLEVQGISQKIIPSLLGGPTMLIISTTAYIADISTIQMRTLRLGIVQIVISVVLPTIQSFSGIFFVKAGYLAVLFTSSAFHLIALIYGLLCIKEKLCEESKEIKSLSSILMDMFDLQHAKDTFNLLVKKTDNNDDRLLLWLLVIMAFLHRFAFEGETNVLYLYTQNVFQWTPLEYSYFLTINSLVALIGHLFGVPIFTEIFKLSDSLILFIAIIDKILTNICFGLAKTVDFFYIGIGLSIVTRLYRTAKKSIATKIVNKNDIGKTQCLLGIFDVLAPAISVPIYNKIIYLKTLHIYPSAFFFFSIVIYGVCGFIAFIIYAKFKRKTDKITNQCLNSLNTSVSEQDEMVVYTRF